MASSFEGKVIAITGAASGMGLATAQHLASRGATVSLGDMNETALLAAVESLPATSISSSGSSGNGKKKKKHHMVQVIDVRDSETVDSWICETVKMLGRLDGAVNMAGVIRPACPVTRMTDADWDFVFAVNARGVFACLRAQVKAMERGGSIVSAASVFGQMGSPGVAAYCASKAAVIALVRTAAKENPHVRMNCVAPGSVNTPMSAGEDPEDVKRGLQGTVQKRRAEASEVANVIAFLLSDEASFVTGAVFNVDGGWMC